MQLSDGPIDAVIFDWAGTAVDFGCLAPTEVFIEAFKTFNVPVADSEVRSLMGLEKKTHIRELLRLASVGARFREYLGRDWTEADVNAIYDRFVPLQIEILPKFADPVPGLVAAVRDLRFRGVGIGSTTGYSRAMMNALAPAAAAKGFAPDVIICSDEVAEGRPSPFMAFRALEALGVHSPWRAVKVDDTPAGIAEGINAGMWAVGVAISGNAMGLSLAEYDGLPEDDQAARERQAINQLHAAGAHFVIEGAWDLPDVLAEIEGAINRGERP